MSRRSLSGHWASAALAAMAAFVPAHAGQTGDTALAVGVRHAPPALVAGAKVRTPESTGTFLVADLADSMGRSPNYQAWDVTAMTPVPQAVDVLVADLTPEQAEALGRDWTMVATGQINRPMAIMRTDTDIKSWDQLKGRTVCVAQDGRHVGRFASRFGAVEQVYRAPADALLALRIGKCDAAVHDDTLLKALLRFPEWRKFSASLTLNEGVSQYLAIPAGRPELVKAVKARVKHWQRFGYYGKLTHDMSRDIAFEVYLDQAVPDCH